MAKYRAAVGDHLVLPALVRPTLGQESLFRMAGQDIPSPVPVRLLIDTGARRTTLVPRIIQHLQPPSGHEVEVVTPVATLASSLFWVRLEFPEAGLADIPHVQVARLAMPARLSMFHGLLGRDLLRYWESFLYEGRRGRYTLQDTPRRWLGWLRGR
jgi:hypothetical protein